MSDGTAVDLESPCLSELVKIHEQDLKKLRSELNAQRAEEDFDDVFLLRYLLSNGDPGHHTVEAVKKAQYWRKEYSTLVASAKANACSGHLDSSALKEYMSDEDLATLDSCLKATFTCSTTQPPDFPMYVIHSGKAKLTKLMGQVSIESVGLWLTWRNEIGFWRCDAASRKSDRLLKQIIVMNMAETSFWEQDMRFFMAYGNSSNRANWLHPQLLARNIVVNPPSYMSFFWMVGRQLVSERLLKKVHVHDGPPHDYLQLYYGGTLPTQFLHALEGGEVQDVSVEDCQEFACQEIQWANKSSDPKVGPEVKQTQMDSKAQPFKSNALARVAALLCARICDPVK